MDKDALANFLRRALVWPDPASDTGWVNLHWRPADRKGITGGQAFKKLEDVVGFTKWACWGEGVPFVGDLYYCTSLQREHGEAKKSGRYSALRSADNALSSKLLFADVDKYASKSEALANIFRFCEVSGSPHPSAIVDSGGGLHAYWILSELLQKDAWLDASAKFDGLMTAHGLKHDNISTDIARILRLPETFNYKRGDPQKVFLKELNGDVDLAAWKSLHDATPVAAAHITAHRTAEPSVALESYFLDPNLAKQGPSPIFRNKVPITDLVPEGTLDADPIFAFCPMFAETHATGGKQVGQPVWHQQALACTFLRGGRHLFHDLGCKHPDYSVASTDEMYERKLYDRANKGLGYPSCAAFETDGAQECRGCPLRGKISSPLKITKEMARKATDMVSQPPLDGEPPRLPDGRLQLPPERPEYEYGDPTRGENPQLIYLVQKRKGGDSRDLICGSVITDYRPFKGDKSDGIGLRVWCDSTLDQRTGKPSQVVIDIQPASFGEGPRAICLDLNNNGCMTMSNQIALGVLMLTFRQRMKDAVAHRAVNYGWVYEEHFEGEGQGQPVGFAYNDTIYLEGGRARGTAGNDHQLKETYRVNGEVTCWLEALKCILQMKSPGLETVVLSAFASPLMIFTGHPSTIIMIRGQSGGSKSTASAVSCAAWGRPRTGLLKPSSSKAATLKRVGMARHLPTIWDDIRNSMFETVKDILMEITQGGDGLKLTQQREERVQGVWDSMLVVSSNNSLVEYLEEISKNDGAALLRCFEFEVPKILNGDVGYVNPNYLSPLIAELDFNHGHIGREYAQMLGKNPEMLKARYKTLSDQLSERLSDQGDFYQPYERFWLAAVATTLMGAQLANELPSIKAAGLRFDTEQLETFLRGVFFTLRARMKQANIQADTAEFVGKHLSDFINTYATQRSGIVWTLHAPAKAGKPVLVAPLFPIGDEARNLKQVMVRWVVSDRVVRISKKALDDYLRKEKISVDRVQEGLIKYYKAEKIRSRIASGILRVTAQSPEWFYEIKVRPGSWLDDQLMMHSTDAPVEIALKPPLQTPGPVEPHPQPEQTGPVAG